MDNITKAFKQLNSLSSRVTEACLHDKDKSNRRETTREKLDSKRFRIKQEKQNKYGKKDKTNMLLITLGLFKNPKMFRS